jgi:Cys-rich protein (TIGR01571 family)
MFSESQCLVYSKEVPEFKWTHGLFDCLSDYSVCCYSCCCMPCAVSELNRKANGDKVSILSYCMNCCGSLSLSVYQSRQQIRRRTGGTQATENGTIEDYIATSCCLCCSITQAMQHINLNPQFEYRFIPNVSQFTMSEMH